MSVMPIGILGAAAALPLLVPSRVAYSGASVLSPTISSPGLITLNPEKGVLFGRISTRAQCRQPAAG